ncbi:MAG: 50S ribosomal protein L1, partial [Propionibacteriaceae bacterium]|nr:50S ribosomal protein L1 [Propionibacteriaceae bacterium]
MKRSKSYVAAAEKVDPDNLYPPVEAVTVAKAGAKAKFDETVDVSVRLGVDPRKADQMVRGTVNLPHGTGKTARVLVFATGDRAEAAMAAGADEVGSDDMIEKVAGGYLDFDAVVATPD